MTALKPSIAQWNEGRAQQLPYKGEHVDDLESDLLLAVKVNLADQGGAETLVKSVM